MGFTEFCRNEVKFTFGTSVFVPQNSGTSPDTKDERRRGGKEDEE